MTIVVLTLQVKLMWILLLKVFFNASCSSKMEIRLLSEITNARKLLQTFWIWRYYTQQIIKSYTYQNSLLTFLLLYYSRVCNCAWWTLTLMFTVHSAKLCCSGFLTSLVNTIRPLVLVNISFYWLLLTLISHLFVPWLFL